MIRLLNFRALSNSHVRLVKTKKDDQLQAHIDTRGFIRLFGSKGTKRNVFLSTRKSSQRLFLPLLLMPLYIVPLTDAAGLPYVSSVDFLSATLGLIVCHSVCLMRLYLARQQYPLVHNVLFNPYTGDVILESENWSSFVKSSFKLGRWRRATLVPRHIPRDNAEQFHVLGTSSPQGMVIQPDEFSPRGEFVDGGHLGYVHYYNKFNEQPFDNYINELAANPLLNKMIDIRLGTLVS